MAIMQECPFCHKMSFGEITPSTGDSFVLTEINCAKKEFIPTSGLPVKVMGCSNCKNILLKHDALNFIPD